MNLLSIVIPIYNEQAILEKEVAAMQQEMKRHFSGVLYEILLVENGSVDQTRVIAESLTKQFSEIRLLYLPAASYGKALKYGLEQSQGVYTILFNIDFWDVAFIAKAIEMLEREGLDMVVGSKIMRGAEDTRPWLRRLITRLFNRLLTIAFGFKGTDTHGIKLIWHEKIIPVIQACKTEREIFDTEFVLRAQLLGLKSAEIPVVCEEKRKTTYHISKRIPRTIKDLIVLFFSLRNWP